MKYLATCLLLVLSLQAYSQVQSQPSEAAREACRSHFPTLTQSGGQQACDVGAASQQKDGTTKAIESCKEKYVVSGRDELACRIGAGLAEELNKNSELDSAKLKTCQELYPVVTALDAYFQEACLAGAYAFGSSAKSDISSCESLSSDRAFIGPCAAGLSVSRSEEAKKVSVSEQNKLCLQYFDKTQFHTGYRACLNSRALSLLPEGKKSTVVSQCDLVISNNKSDTERAACIVGASIFKALADGAPTNARFTQCGEGKVSYQDRDYLACLTAASLLDFMPKSKANSACKSVFPTRKSKNRGQCANALLKF